MDVLAEANQGRLAYRLIGFPTEILCNPVGDLFRQPGLSAWLKQRQVVKAVALVVNDHIPVNFLVRREPLQHFFAARHAGQVRAHVGERDAVVLRRKEADGIGPP